MGAFRDEELNRRRHLRALQAGLVFLAISQCVAYAGWWHASGVQRLSLPPQLRYGATLRSGEIHPWEVYTFAGYIHQQINNWNEDGGRENRVNIHRLSAFLGPEYKNWLLRQHERYEPRFRGRQRGISYVPDSYGRNSVQTQDPDTWHVVLDVRLRDYLESQLYKDIDVRYYLEVAAQDTNPEMNSWGLVLNRQYRVPERLRSHLSVEG